MIKIEKANKYFNRRKRNEIHIINDTSLELEDKGLVALLGPSGSGKTTLLNTIGGLDKINRGKIFVNGKKISTHSKHSVDKIRNLNIGYIFQDYKLIDNMSVFDNVAIALKMIGIKDKKQITERVNYVLEAVNMYRYRNRPAKMLSGGERQRVAIARAIVKNPNIVIADEPTGNLDSKNSLEIMNIIKSISNDKLVILVTHEVELARFYASRIIELQDGKITKDYQNEVNDNLDYRLENKIYLKDIKNNDQIGNENVNIDLYTETDEKLNIKIIVKNGNIYIKSEENKKVEIIDENSAVEFVNDNYKKIDKSIYEQYKFDLDKLSTNKKLRYSSIYGITRSIIYGFKKIYNYSVLKKLLLIGFFASAMFITYAVCNIAGTLDIRDEDFIQKNKDYLQVELPKLEVAKYLEYETAEGVNYILPGDSNIPFQMKFNDYYQTSKNAITVEGSMTALDTIKEEEITKGRMATNDYEIVIDKLIVDNLLDGESGMAKHMGVKSEDELLQKQVYVTDMNKFTIVGFVDKKSPSIYVSRNQFINLLNSVSNADNNTFAYAKSPEEDIQSTEAKVKDYNLYLDDITLEKGRLPEDDYEVIVNISKQYDMKLNEDIKDTVNEVPLTVVGYYESMSNRQDFLVNSNTVKYSVITKATDFMVYPKDEETVTKKFKDEYGLNIYNKYEKDKAKYLKEKEESMTSAIIFAAVILGISLVEIYLMIRSSFLSRIKEVGVLRAIGVKRLDIYRMFIGEILAITTLAGVPGVAFMTYCLKTLSTIQLMSRMFVINVATIGISIIIIYIFNVIVGLMPLFKVLRKTPAQILARHDVE